MGYSTSTPRKMQRTSTGKRRRGKSQPRQLFTAGPTRTLVSRSGVPEIKRIDYDFATTNGFHQSACFLTHKGTANGDRMGNSIQMKSIKVLYDWGGIGLTGSSQPPQDLCMSLYIVRDKEPHALAPASASHWAPLLFSAPVNAKWNTNFRNPDNTERFQIVKRVDISSVDRQLGLVSGKGYLELPLNGAQAKYKTGIDASTDSAPINTRYYVFYNITGATNASGLTLRVREEFTDN